MPRPEQSEIGGVPAIIRMQNASGDVAGNVGDVQVQGVTEVDTYERGLTANRTVTGAIGLAFTPQTGFEGTIQGQTYVFADGPIERAAQPGNLIPSFPITRTAGAYDLYTVKPPA